MNCIDCEYCGFVVPRRHWFMCRCYRKSARGREVIIVQKRRNIHIALVVWEKAMKKERKKRWWFGNGRRKPLKYWTVVEATE